MFKVKITSWKEINILQLVQKAKKWIQRSHKIVIILGSAPIIGPLFYFADVWTVGSFAASIHDLKTVLDGVSILATPEQKAAMSQTKMLPYIIAHPVITGWAWLTRPDKLLSHPDIKSIWKWLNLGLAIVTALAVVKRMKGVKGKNSADKVHGLRINDNATFGTSRWAARKDIAHLCDFGPPKKEHGGIILGELEKKIVRVIPGKSPQGKPGLAGHVAVFGGTGSGKTYSFVLDNIIAAAVDGQSIICIDPKGELAANTSNWLQNQGYNVKVFNLSNPATSNRWNAITECTNDAEISEMATCLIQNAGKDDNTYFLSKEIQLLEAISGLLRGAFPAEEQHLRAAMSLTAWTKEELDSRFQEAFQQGKISPTIYERWRGVSSASLDYAVSGLSAKLKILTTEHLAALLSEHEINLSELGKQKTALFCVIPVSGEGKVLKPILSTFYMFLFKRLYRLADLHNGKLPVPVRFLLDEFANIGQIPGFSEIISTARSLGINIQFILQGRSQLDDVYGPNEAKNILANCPTLLLLGVPPGDQETALMFSKILGEAAVEGRYEKEDISIPFLNHLQLSQKTKTTTRRSLMQPDEITRIDALDAIALIQWCYPLYLKKIGWVDLPQASEIKGAGILPVSQLVPPRDFKIKLPEMFGEEGVQSSEESMMFLKTKIETPQITVGELTKKNKDAAEKSKPDNLIRNPKEEIDKENIITTSEKVVDLDKSESQEVDPMW